MTQQTILKSPETFKLSHIPLVIGIMDKINLGGLVNERIPKVGPHVRIQSGELVKIMCMRYLSGMMPGGINSLDKFALSLPANLLGTEASDGGHPYEAVNRDVSRDLLDRIDEYGAARFQTEIITSVIDTKSIEVAHLDSTSYHVHGRPQYNDEDATANESMQEGSSLLEISNKPLSLAHGYSRDNRPDLPQVNHIGVSARVAGVEGGVLLYQAAFDGNMNDTARFQQFCADGELEYLMQNCPNLRVLVGDSALASAKAIHACHAKRIELVTRLQDSKVKSEYADVNAGKIKLSTIELPVPEWETEDAESKKVQYAWLEPAVIKLKDKSEVSVQRILYVAESMRDRKTASLRAKAEKELREVSAALNKLRTSPKSCKPDAIKDFKALERKLKLVTIDEPVYEDVMGFATRGRPKAGAEKQVIAVRVIANASINEDALEAAINSELYYVLATTNMDIKHSRKEALAIHQTYHGQADIESQWRDLKATGTFFDSVFLKTPGRIKALLAVVTIALFVGRLLMTDVRSVLKEHTISLSTGNSPKTYRPTLKTFIRFATDCEENTVLTVHPDFVLMSDQLNNSVLYLIAKKIGETATKLYSAEFYTSERHYIYNSIREQRQRLRTQRQS